MNKALREEVSKKLGYHEAKLPGIIDTVSFFYPGLVVMLTYCAYFYREKLINDELYDRIQENIERFTKDHTITSGLLVAEAIKFFSSLAYNVLVVLYLIKPLRQETNEEKNSKKQVKEILEKVRAEKQANPEIQRKVAYLRESSLASKYSRLIEYNRMSLLLYKQSLSMDFIFSCCGMISFVVNKLFVNSYLPFFSFYFENMINGLQFLKLTYFLVQQYTPAGYTFRKVMILLFVGVFAFGKLFEVFQLSAYHEYQTHSLISLAAVMTMYLIVRYILNEIALGRGLRKAFYWIGVGNITKDLMGKDLSG